LGDETTPDAPSCHFFSRRRMDHLAEGRKEESKIHPPLDVVVTVRRRRRRSVAGRLATTRRSKTTQASDVSVSPSSTVGPLLTFSKVAQAEETITPSGLLGACRLP